MGEGASLKIGDTQHMTFQDNDDVPLIFSKIFEPTREYPANTFKPDKYDREMYPWERAIKDKQLQEARKRKAKKNTQAQPQDDTATTEEIPPETDEEAASDLYTVRGYVGQSKGILQCLHERGLYKNGMSGKLPQQKINERIMRGEPLPDDSLDAAAVIDGCQDFMNETTILEEIFIEKGHILVSSVKCHPEMAGCGIEYSWGKLKLKFRRENAKCNLSVRKGGRSTEQKIRDILDESLPLARCWKFERKTRDYRRMYLDLEEQLKSKTIKKEDINYRALESMMKRQKTHRNIMELDKVFIDLT